MGLIDGSKGDGLKVKERNRLDCLWDSCSKLPQLASCLREGCKTNFVILLAAPLPLFAGRDGDGWVGRIMQMRPGSVAVNRMWWKVHFQNGVDHRSLGFLSNIDASASRDLNIYCICFSSWRNFLQPDDTQWIQLILNFILRSGLGWLICPQLILDFFVWA